LAGLAGAVGGGWRACTEGAAREEDGATNGGDRLVPDGREAPLDGIFPSAGGHLPSAQRRMLASPAVQKRAPLTLESSFRDPSSARP